MALRGALLTYLQGKFVNRDYFWDVRFRLFSAVVMGHGAFMHEEAAFENEEGVPIAPNEDFVGIESLARLNHVTRLFSRWINAYVANGMMQQGQFLQYADDHGRQQNRNWGQLVEELYSMVQREGYSRDLGATMDGLVLCVFCLAHYGDDEAYFNQNDVLGGPAIRHFVRMFLLSLGGPPQNPLVDVAIQVGAVAEAIDAATQVDAQQLESEEEDMEDEQQQQPDSSHGDEQPQQPEQRPEETPIEADLSAKDVRRKRPLQSEIEEEKEEEEVHVDEDGDVTMETETETEEVASMSRGPKRRRILKLSYKEESLRAEEAKRHFGLRATPARKKWLARLKEADDAKRKSDEAEGSSDGSRKRSRR